MQTRIKLTPDDFLTGFCLLWRLLLAGGVSWATSRGSLRGRVWPSASSRGYYCSLWLLLAGWLGRATVPSMSFDPDFIQISSDFIQILSRFHPDFIQTLSKFYPNFIQIFLKLTLSKFYPDFIQILFG